VVDGNTFVSFNMIYHKGMNFATTKKKHTNTFKYQLTERIIYRVAQKNVYILYSSISLE